MKDSTYLLNQRIERLLDVVNTHARQIEKITQQIERITQLANAQTDSIKALENNVNVLRDAFDQLCDESPSNRPSYD